MDVARQIDDEQTKLWNGPAGRAWIDAQECLDQMFKPLEDLLVEAAFSGGSVPRGRVLDVGCGTGSTTLAVARLLGANGCCVGIDISDPLVAAARARAERESTPACFIHANAQNHVFEPASFDMIFSRFGVMFFDDFVQAFANLKRAAKEAAELTFVAWRSPAENPVHDDGRARCGAAPAKHSRPPAECVGAVRLRRPPPNLPHSGGERLG